jgi:hypothetical protein
VSISLDDPTESLSNTLQNAKYLQKHVRIQNNTSPSLLSASKGSQKHSPAHGEFSEMAEILMMYEYRFKQ